MNQPPQVFGERFQMDRNAPWFPDDIGGPLRPGLDQKTQARVLLALSNDLQSPLETEQRERAIAALTALRSPRLALPLAHGFEQELHWTAHTLPPGELLAQLRPPRRALESWPPRPAPASPRPPPELAAGPHTLSLMLGLCLAAAEAQSRGLVLRELHESQVFLDEDRVCLLVPGQKAGRYDVGNVDSLHPAWGARRTNDAHLDARSDVWLLGRLLFRMATGQGPVSNDCSPPQIYMAMIKGDFPRLVEVVPDAPAGLGEVISRCLAPERDQRFPDAAAVARALLPLRGRNDALSRAVEALPPAAPEQVDWAHVERLAVARRERSSGWSDQQLQAVYDLTEARRMLAAHLLLRGDRDEAVAVLDRALADDPTEELQQARKYAALR